VDNIVDFDCDDNSVVVVKFVFVDNDYDDVVVLVDAVVKVVLFSLI